MSCGWWRRRQSGRGVTYDSKCRGQDEGNADHMNGLVDAVVVKRRILEIVLAIATKMPICGKARRCRAGAYEDEVSLEIERHCGKWSRELRCASGKLAGAGLAGSERAEPRSRKKGTKTRAAASCLGEYNRRICWEVQGDDGEESFFP